MCFKYAVYIVDCVAIYESGHIDCYFVVLHPKLTELVVRNNKAEDEAKKTEVAVTLLEAYASLTCCCIQSEGFNYLP